MSRLFKCGKPNTKVILSMRTIVSYFNNLFIRLLPETKFFGLKRTLWKMAGVSIEDNVRICSSVKILGAGKLHIGCNTWVGTDVLINTSAEVVIGRDCDIAPRVFIGDGTHIITPERQRVADLEVSIPIHIGNGCWLCANSSILPGVKLGNKCVVAAGAIVSNSFEDDMSLIAGVPAIVKKKLK